MRMGLSSGLRAALMFAAIAAVAATILLGGSDTAAINKDSPSYDLVQPNQSLPKCDVVFKIDESGSMGPDITEVKARVNAIASQLGASCDFQLGLVGFGATTGHSGTTSNGEAHIHQTLTSDVPTFQAAVNGLVASGGFEPGFSATVLAESGAMGTFQSLRPCDILISDEDADIGVAPSDKTQGNALDALTANNAVFVAVVIQNSGNTAVHYGPNVGSLAEATGGETFDLLAFRSDPGPVLTLILDKCIEEALTVVGGIAEVPSVAETAPASEGSSSSADYTLPLAAAVAGAVVALAAGGWYARRRFLR